MPTSSSSGNFLRSSYDPLYGMSRGGGYGGFSRSSFRPMGSSGYSFSGSQGTSTGRSRSESGERYSPEQWAWLQDLYPQILERFQGTGGRSSSPWQGLFGGGGASMGQFGIGQDRFGSPADFGRAPDYGTGFDFGRGDFGRPADFGRAADFGQAAMLPDITAGPVWSPEQIQAQVNQARASSASQTGGAIRDLAANLAGRGFGAASPLAQELTAALQGQDYANQARAENELRWGAAEGNAGHLLRSQQAAVERATALSSDDFRRRQAGAADELQRRALGAADELQRRALTAADDYQRRQATATDQLNRMRYGSDDQFRRASAAADDQYRRLAGAAADDVARRGLWSQYNLGSRDQALRAYLGQMQTEAQREGILLQALNSMLRPLSYSFSDSSQDSRNQSGGFSSGGYRG